MMKYKIIGLIAVSLLTGSCVYHDIPEEINCDAANLHIEVLDSVNASVCGAKDGSLTVQATGGSEPYLFSINNGPPQSSGVFSNLESRIYSITVTDKNLCDTKIEGVVISVESFLVDFDFEPDKECLTNDGSMEVTVQEPNGPYQFKLDEEVFTSANFFENLKDGDHFLAIQDKDGCNVQMKVAVPRGNTTTSWENDILPIMTTSCAVTGCHNGISRVNDWSKYSEVAQNAATIRQKTQDKSMPFDGSLTQDQIDMIACWVDDGAQNN